MNVRHLDLNLLAVFEALYLERSVTRASRRLGLTQPAVSNALRRLRLMFEDPLFVRTSGGMTPTHRALAAGPTVQSALESLRGSIGSDRFDPAQSTSKFVVCSLDYIDALHLAPVIDEIHRISPGISVHLGRLDAIFDLPEEQLEAGSMDCAISLFPQPLSPKSSLRCSVLGQDEWVCIARAGHKTLKAPLTLEGFAAVDQIAINIGTVVTSSGMIDRQLAERGLKRSCPIAVSSFMAVPFHVAASDCIAIVPRRLAETFARAVPLQIVKPPPELRSFDVSLVWHLRTDANPAHRWFREIVKSRCTFGSSSARKSN